MTFDGPCSRRPLLALATVSAAQTEEELLSELIAGYRDASVAEDRAYRAGSEDLDPDPRYDPFELSDGALYRVPVTEGVDALFLHAEIRCGYMGWGYNCGTAGCSGHLIVEGEVYDYWGRPPISVRTRPGEYQLLIPTRWSGCRDVVDPEAYTAPGVAPCYVAVTWFDGRFVSREPILTRRETEKR